MKKGYFIRVRKYAEGIPKINPRGSNSNANAGKIDQTWSTTDQVHKNMYNATILNYFNMTGYDLALDLHEEIV